MYEPLKKSTENKNSRFSSYISRKQNDVMQAHGFADNRAENVVQKELQTDINNSSRNKKIIHNNNYSKSIVQRQLFISGSQKYAVPDRSEEEGLIAAADKYRVPESEISKTLQRWIQKNKKYIFVSWNSAFDEAGKGKLKTAKGDEEKIDALAKARDDELNAIEDAAFREELRRARDALREERDTAHWEAKRPERELVGALKTHARARRDKVSAVVIENNSLDILGIGRSGSLAGHYRIHDHRVLANADGEATLATELTKGLDGGEDWVPWACGEAAAAENALKSGNAIAGKRYLAGQQGGAVRRKPACGNCSRWVNEIGQLDLGGGVRY